MGELETLISELSLTELEKEVAEIDLLEFTKQAWHIIEPGRELKVNWHLQAMAEHLEAVSRGDIQKLVINVWPRSTKSTLVSVMWPAWEWINKPHLNWLYASAAERTATRDALKSRSIITSPWYQERWGGKFKLTSDQNEKKSYKNDNGGTRNVFGITSKTTGENADRLVLDDPNDANDARSPKGRDIVIDAWENKLRTRLNDITESTVVIVQQRIHSEDLTGILTIDDTFEHLVLPMEYEEENRSKTSLGFIDPRSEIGELADPNRFPREALEELKKPRIDADGAVVGGATFYATQYQQRPQAAEGGIIKREWWKWYDPADMPHLRSILKSYDTAYKEGEENDPSAMTEWAQLAGNHYIMDIWEGRLEYPELKRFIANNFDDKPVPEVLIEDKASGQSLLQEFKSIVTPAGRRMNVIAMMPGGSTKDPEKAQFSMPSSKLERVHFVAPLIEGGHVWLPRGNKMALKLVEQFALFPNGSHDDIVDTVTQRLCRSMVVRRHVTKRKELII